MGQQPHHYRARGHIGVGREFVPSPSIAVGASDLRHVMWYDNTTVGSESDYEVDYRRWDGSSWAATANFSQDQYGSKNPQVAASGSKVYLAWSDVQNGNRGLLYGSMYS